MKKIYLFLSSAFLSFSVFTNLVSAQAITITFQPDGDCGKDAIIADCIPCGYDNTNFGNSPEFDAIAWTNLGNISNGRALIQFDLTSIPAGSVVQSALLSVYFDSTSSNGQHSSQSGPDDANMMKITSPWFEHTVTWNTQPGTDPTNEIYFPQSVTATDDYLNLDATGMVQDFVNNPAQNYGMMLQLVTEFAYRKLIFSSSDYPNPARHPKLVVTYIPATSNCLELQYASCNGVDAMIGDCVPCGYDTMNLGDSPEIDAIAWTNNGNTSDARSLLYWDLSSIPTNAIVTSAYLSLYTWNSPSNGQHSDQSGPNDAYINKVTSPWDEYSVNWNTMPSVDTTNHAYLPPTNNPLQDYLNTDVTALVQDMVTNPSTNYGLMLQLVTESYYRKLIFASSDHADPAKYPKLEICYSVPSGISDITNENNISVSEDFATQFVTVKSSNNFETGASLHLYNAAGQLVRKFEHLKGQAFIFSKSGLAGGVYLYQLVSGSKIVNGKVLFR